MTGSLLKKWWRTMKVYWAQTLVYRLNFFLLVIGPALVFFFIKYNLWTHVYSLKKSQPIQGYTLSQMLQYHLFVLIVGLIGQGHSGRNLAEDIRMGRISSYLVYPFNFWEFHSAQFLGFQVVQTFIASVTLIAVFALGLIPDFQGQGLVMGFLFSWTVGLFWFCLQYLVGLMAFWLEETWVVGVIFLISAQFFSGAVIPLELFPSLVQKILAWSPFPYLTFYPVKIFMGQMSEAQIGFGFFMLMVWIGVMILVNRVIWQRGLRLYTAAGM